MYYFGRQFCQTSVSNQPSPGFLCEDPADRTKWPAVCWNQSSSRVWQTHWGCFCFREMLENLPLTNQTLFLPPSLPLSPLPSKRHGPLNPFFFLLSLSILSLHQTGWWMTWTLCWPSPGGKWSPFFTSWKRSRTPPMSSCNPRTAWRASSGKRCTFILTWLQR